MSIIKDPAFWDIFGFFAFVYIVIISIKLLQGNVLEFYIWILLLIGVIGLIVDGIIVYRKWFLNYLLK